jgi:triacylglycerol lipase
MRIEPMHLSVLLFILAAGLRAAPAPAQTSSPFPPPDEQLGTYVANAGPGLDTGCTFRGGGPLLIHVPLPVLVNPKQLNADGTLKNAAKLVADGVLSAQATVRFPVFDIDDKAVVQGFAPEVDRVSFNGRFKKTLEGFNNTWTDDSLVVPIEELKFGRDNELHIDIDTANPNDELWCMAVDWISVEFEVTPPYVLQHGVAANASSWDEANAPGALAAMEARGVLYTRFSLGSANSGNASVAANAAELKTDIGKFLEPLKSKKVHVISHSKGGLDTQAMQALAPDFEIVSLSTLSTPHLGSSAADLLLVNKKSADEKINSGADPHGYVKAFVEGWTLGQGPQFPALNDLTTAAAKNALTTGQRGNIDTTYTIGASADANGDDLLTESESAPLFPSNFHYAAERAWHVLRDFASASMTTATVPGKLWGTRTVLTYTTVATSTAQANDLAVTESSANPDYGKPLGNGTGNHLTVKSRDNINIILDTTIPLK